MECPTPEDCAWQHESELTQFKIMALYNFIRKLPEIEYAYNIRWDYNYEDLYDENNPEIVFYIVGGCFRIHIIGNEFFIKYCRDGDGFYQGKLVGSFSLSNPDCFDKARQLLLKEIKERNEKWLNIRK